MREGVVIPPLAAVPSDETPWEWFGAFKNDPTWETLFEEIEQRREATRKGQEPRGKGDNS